MAQAALIEMRSRFLPCACTFLLLALLSVAASAATIYDYTSLISKSEQAISSAIRAEKTAPGSSREIIVNLRRNLPASMEVSSSGQSINTSFKWLRDDLASLESAPRSQRISLLNAMQTRLQAARSAIDNASPTDSSLNSRAAASLKKILAQREYQPNPKESWWKKAIAAFTSALERLNLPEGVRSVISFVLTMLVIVAFVFALGMLILKIVDFYNPTEVRTRSAVKAGKPENRTRSIAAAIEAAERDAAAGRYRDAFRNLYLAAIFTLDRAKLVKYADGITNWEYLRTLKRQPNAEPVETFQEMTLSFDELIYGKQDVREQDYTAARIAVDALRRSCDAKAI